MDRGRLAKRAIIYLAGALVPWIASLYQLYGIIMSDVDGFSASDMYRIDVLLLSIISSIFWILFISLMASYIIVPFIAKQFDIAIDSAKLNLYLCTFLMCLLAVSYAMFPVILYFAYFAGSDGF
ncbi:MAG: hypothetical protein RIG82_13215 [Phycisphaeraceae bacterium]